MTDDADKLTAKIYHYANEAFGHDGSSIVADGNLYKSVGNPLFSVLRPLQCNLLYRAGVIDGRNKASSFCGAQERLERIYKLEDKLEALHQKYDGIDPNRLDAWFDLPVLGSKPGYDIGESQLFMPLIQGEDEQGVEVAGLLLEEAQICATGLAEVAPRVGSPQAPLFPGIPLVRIFADCPAERRGVFVEKIRASGAFPVRLTLGDFSIDASDRAIRHQSI